VEDVEADIGRVLAAEIKEEREMAEEEGVPDDWLYGVTGPA
jgi:hypothetical protein